MISLGIEAVERGIVPDAITRIAIRRLCRQRLCNSRNGSADPEDRARARFLDSMRSGPIALVPERANQQHYELPPEFFAAVLGPRLKYSCCYFSSEDTTLPAAEEAALQRTCQRADLDDGQDILELGCGWGSLSFWMAEQFPNSQITAVSNSTVQRLYIESQIASRGVNNLEVVTCDMNNYSAGEESFDRIVSVEMFEHMRNYESLLSRIASWLKPEGKLFVHIFCHRSLSYPFETDGATNWMGRHFFTGGIMPSADLFQQFDRDMAVSHHSLWSGRHYQRTAEAWLANLDSHHDEVRGILAKVYGANQANRWLNRWRMFFLAVSELFGYSDGKEWCVGRYVMEPVLRSERCLR